MKISRQYISGNGVKWILPFLLFTLLPVMANAQIKFGYCSYDEAMKALPEYTTVQNRMSMLESQYGTETKRAEREFNRKYEQFLEGINEFAPAIRQKRQVELQELMEKNVAFRKEAARLLEAAKRDAYLPLKDKVAAVMQKIGAERGYAFILNTDNNACLYIDKAMGEDITLIVKDALNAQ